MTNKLVLENSQLRSQLQSVLEQAHRNQQLMQRYQGLDLIFIEANTFQELIDSVFNTLSESSELDVVTMTLIDPQSEIQRILTELRIDISSYPNLIFIQQLEGREPLTHPTRIPLLGPCNKMQHNLYFPDSVLQPASAAIIPLTRRDMLIGWLGLGSLDPARFAAHMASDFLQHMGSIVAICVENVLNTERLHQIGLTDPLTGVNNRRYVEQRLEEEVGRTRRHGYALSTMYIDLDHFKNVNDTYGHQGGDEVLCAVATRIKAELRLNDALGRFGGEEFVVVLIDAALESALVVAERIRVGVGDQPIMLSTGEQLHVTVSIGISTLTGIERTDVIATTSQQLLAKADQALYRAKQGGRNRIEIADMDSRS